MKIFFALAHHVDTIDTLLLVVNKTSPGKEKRYMYVVNIYERCSFNIFISFSSTSFSLGNVHILSVKGSLYVVGMLPLGINDR